MEEERQMREFHMQQIKQSWEDSLNHKKDLAAQPAVPDFDLSNCSTSSALRFAGEDPKRAERISMQKEQMRRWIQEQLAEKAQLAYMRNQEEMSYADMIKAIDAIREATEKEEREMRQYVIDTVKQYNLELAEAQKHRNRNQNIVQAEEGQEGKDIPTSLDLFNEDKELAVDAKGRVVRRDMFKGFTEQQKRKMILENEAVIRERRYLTSSFSLFAYLK